MGNYKYMYVSRACDAFVTLIGSNLHRAMHKTAGGQLSHILISQSLPSVNTPPRDYVLSNQIV